MRDQFSNLCAALCGAMTNVDENELVEKLIKGELKPYEVEAVVNHDSKIATRIRRTFLEKKYKAKLTHIGESVIDFNDAINRNIENSIGAAQIPIGYAGELRVNGEYSGNSYPILLATTEGKLVAGVSRGIGVLNKAGGVTTTVLKDGMTRDILMRTGSAREAAKLARWIISVKGFSKMNEIFGTTTKHGKLIEARPFIAGRDIHVRFKATTGAAMGMNMLTISAKKTAEEIIKIAEKELGIKPILISESGNMCTDKKPAFINFIEGRGVTVVADVMIPEALVKERFKVSPEAIVELNKAKNLTGSLLAGIHGGNAQTANILAALYIAHGQDVAQITEGAQALTDASVVEGDLYISCYLPSIEVGTYGGGTKRETAREALELLGLYGESDPEGKTRLAFAEVVAAVCLAGDLNLVAAQAAGELSKSHGGIKRG